MGYVEDIIMSLYQIPPGIARIYFTFRHRSDAPLFTHPQGVPHPQQNNRKNYLYLTWHYNGAE